MVQAPTAVQNVPKSAVKSCLRSLSLPIHRFPLILEMVLERLVRLETWTGLVGKETFQLLQRGNFRVGVDSR